jgi:hypothetical protein
MKTQISTSEIKAVTGGSCDCWCKPTSGGIGGAGAHIGSVANRETCKGRCSGVGMMLESCH